MVQDGAEWGWVGLGGNGWDEMGWGWIRWCLSRYEVRWSKVEWDESERDRVTWSEVLRCGAEWEGCPCRLRREGLVKRGNRAVVRMGG